MLKNHKVIFINSQEDAILMFFRTQNMFREMQVSRKQNYFNV